MASELQVDPMQTSEPGLASKSKNEGKTWKELKAAVKDTRKLVSSLASRVPSSFTFRTVETENGPVTR